MDAGTRAHDAASTSTTTAAVAAAALTPTRSPSFVGHPAQQLETEEAGDAAAEADTVYPTGVKLWATVASLCLAVFLNGLDLTIVAVAVPSLTNHFKTTADIGLYSAAYGLVSSAFVFFFGKVYTLFPMKPVFLAGVALFLAGSLLCTFAVSSKMFILGRATSGLGMSAVGGGTLKLLKQLFPLDRQAMMFSVVGACQSVGLVAAPVIGGVLVDKLTWRSCFGINIPLNLLCLAFMYYGFEEPRRDADTLVNLQLRDKLKQLDLLGVLVVMPAITLLFLALQWGGVVYGWRSPVVIALFVLGGCLMLAFAYVQYRKGDDAVIPPRIVRQRSIMGGVWYSACCNGALAVTEYYMAIYFQGVRGYSAAKSGLLGVPMIVGLSAAGIASGAGITWLGYYFPFMIATSVLAPVASGLLTTLDFEGSIVKAAGLLAFLGVAIGLGIQGPQIATQRVLDARDVSIGGAIILFGAGMGSSLWVCTSATLFHERLMAEVRDYAPTVNATALADVGLSDIRAYIGSERLGAVLNGYNHAVAQTLYLPLALTILTLVGALFTERLSIKKKQS